MLNTIESARRRNWTLVLIALVLVNACGGDGPSGPAATPSLAVTIGGLPAGTGGQVTVTGPGGFVREVSQSTTLSDLQPGTYTVASAEVSSAAGDVFRAEPATQTVTLAAARTPTQVSVNYAQASGTIVVSLAGLPQGAVPEIEISGPGGTFTVRESGPLRGLLAGAYIVGAAEAVHEGRSFGPSPATQFITVSAGAETPVSVTFSLREINLFISGLHLSQSVQRDDLSVPFVADRDGYARVFVQANISNTESPVVRLRFFRGGAQVDSIDISGVSNVPLDTLPASWNRSWNVRVPGSLLQPGTSVLAMVDPDNQIGERDETDNTYPETGIPRPLEVVRLDPFRIRLIPIVQQDGSVGAVSEANKGAFMSDLLRMMPIAEHEVQVRAPYVASSPTVQASGSNWSAVLNEINALRVADGAPDLYYYGVLNVGYSGGTAGIGFVPGRAALGWDRMPSAPGVLAHELGHNWGRLHAPCGNAGGPDPFYPYAGGIIGVFGIDVANATLKLPDASDIMGYCSNSWVSDYTYHGVLNHRRAQMRVAAARGGEQPVLLLWGRISDRELVLEPAFSLTAKPVLPAAGGRYVLTGHDAAGTELFRVAFTPDRVNEHAPVPEGQFAFAVPVNDRTRQQLASIRLAGDGRHAVQRMHDQDARGWITFDARGNQTVVEWDVARYPMLMLRDSRSGQTVSFARGGRAVVPVPAASLHAVATDGVRSTSFDAASLPER